MNLEVGQRVRIRDGRNLSRNLNPNGIIEVKITEILGAPRFRAYEKSSKSVYVYHIDEIIEIIEIDFNPSKR